jgi:hypothetical protein
MEQLDVRYPGLHDQEFIDSLETLNTEEAVLVCRERLKQQRRHMMPVNVRKFYSIFKYAEAVGDKGYGRLWLQCELTQRMLAHNSIVRQANG